MKAQTWCQSPEVSGLHLPPNPGRCLDPNCSQVWGRPKHRETPLNCGAWSNQGIPGDRSQGGQPCWWGPGRETRSRGSSSWRSRRDPNSPSLQPLPSSDTQHLTVNTCLLTDLPASCLMASNSHLGPGRLPPTDIRKFVVHFPDIYTRKAKSLSLCKVLSGSGLPFFQTPHPHSYPGTCFKLWSFLNTLHFMFQSLCTVWSFPWNSTPQIVSRETPTHQLRPPDSTSSEAFLCSTPYSCPRALTPCTQTSTSAFSTQHSKLCKHTAYLSVSRHQWLVKYVSLALTLALNFRHLCLALSFPNDLRALPKHNSKVPSPKGVLTKGTPYKKATHLSNQSPEPKLTVSPNSSFSFKFHIERHVLSILISRTFLKKKEHF